MTKERERVMSLTNDATPVIAIERSTDDSVADDTAIRRSVSLSRLDKPLPKDPSFEGPSDPFREGSDLLSGSGMSIIIIIIIIGLHGIN